MTQNRNVNASLRKEAVDANAKNYWKGLFGTYGDLLTKNAPRRLKAALELELRAKRTASKTEPLRFLALDVAPLSVVQDGDGFVVEGVFKGATGDAKQPQRLARLFKASLNSEGEITTFRSIEAV
jgi:hypothetical protein